MYVIPSTTVPELEHQIFRLAETALTRRVEIVWFGDDKSPWLVRVGQFSASDVSLAGAFNTLREDMYEEMTKRVGYLTDQIAEIATLMEGL